MKGVSKFIVKSRFVLIPIFVLLICCCAYLSTLVSINYNILDYISADSDSIIATDKLIEEFGSDGIAEVMVVDVSKEEANAIATDISNIDGVSSVVFDDSSEYNYSSNNALFTVYLNYNDYDTKSYEIIDDICAMLEDKEVALGGTSIMSRFLLDVIEPDMVKIMLIATLIVFVILMITSASWIEPFIFLLVIFGAIVINQGTNLIFGEISYITNSIAAVLQLALAMDYSIILLHSYNKQKAISANNKVAMSSALVQSFKPVASSALTTIVGLLALVFMSFPIGFDVGMVLSKGVLISLISVLLFMPGLLLFFDKLIVKTAHRSIFDRLFKEDVKRTRYERFLSKTRIIMPVILIAIFCFGGLTNSNLDYYYYLETSNDEDATINLDAALIEETFGAQNLLVILVPGGDPEAEKQLSEGLYEYTYSEETVVENILSISALGLYDCYDAPSLALKFGVPEDLMSDLFVAMGTESAMLCDVLDYLDTTDYDAVLIQAMSDLIERNYNEMQMLTIDIDSETMAELLGVSSSIIDGIYDQMGGDKVYSLQEVAQTVVDDDLATSMYSDIQEELDYAYQNLGYIMTSSIPLSLEVANRQYYYIPTDTLSELYKANETMTVGELITILSLDKVAIGVGEDITESCQNICKYFDELNQEEIMTLVPLPEEDILLMLADKETMSTYELFEYIYLNDLTDAVGQELAEALKDAQSDASSAYSLFNSDSYTRFIVQISLADSDENSYEVVKEIRELTSAIYQENYISGASAIYSDSSDDFSFDSVIVNLISFFAIFLIIAITFRSLLIPAILSIVIQGSIWLNMSISVFTGSGLFFIVYLVVLCIQTGATIDYAILLTTKYTEHRLTKDKLASASAAMRDSLPTILTSGSILVLATLIIGLFSNITIISSIGIMLARGTFISLTLISLFLPQILVLLDKAIEKTTFNYKPIN